VKPQHPRRPTLRTTPDATAAPRARSSYRYIAGWGQDGGLDAIREYAETIDELAARIENAIAAPAPAPADAPGELTAARS